MAEILTTKLKNDTTRMFMTDIQNNDFYVFVSSITTDTRQSATNAQYSKNEFLENTVFGKKVLGSDTKFMIKYHPWQKDATYVQYDDRIDLDGEKFYAVVGPNDNDTGDYRVFKCLYNNNGGASSAPPNWNAFTTDQIYRTADKYVWKFMYAIESNEFEAYNAIGYIPLPAEFEINPDPNANSAAVVYGSELSDIFIENPVDNNGYPSLDGFMAASPSNSGDMLLRASNINQIQNFYAGMTIYATNPDGVSYLYKIDTYEYEPNSGLGRARVIGDPRGDGVSNIATFSIIPTVELQGDGSGCIAKSEVVAGQITNIIILNPGSGYTNLTASVKDPEFDFAPEDPNSVDVRASLRPVLSPFGGHGYNLIDELYCSHILLYGYITETDNNQIGSESSYSNIGIVKNPEFVSASANTANTPDVFDNRIKIVTDDIIYAIEGDVVTQLDSSNKITFTGKIHEVDDTANTAYISNYMGPFANQANNDISFDPTAAIVNSTGQRIIINSPQANNTIESDYIQRSGQVYFMEDFVPLVRTRTSREEYKLVLEF
jgi:hypothetical protein